MTEPSQELEPEPESAAAVFGDRVDLARRFAAFLGDAGTVRGLIGPRERSRLWTRHVMNSAAAAVLMPAGATVVDIGSGAGLPGIPIAIARPDCALVLVEPLERRCVFLAEAVELLGLDDQVRVVRGRAEQVVAQAGGADVVTSRAVAPLGKLAGWSVPLLRVGGRMLALKGSSAAAEVERDAAELARLGVADVRVHQLGEGVDATFVVDGTLVRAPAGRAKPAGRGPRRR